MINGQAAPKMKVPNKPLPPGIVSPYGRTVRLRRDTYLKVREIAKRTNRSICDVVEMAIGLIE